MAPKIPLQMIRFALEQRLTPLRKSDEFAHPFRGWIKSIREAIGMTPAQLAARMGVSRPRIVQLEKDEMNDSVTLRTLRHAAEALDCTLIYALIPNKPLEQMVLDRAAKVAEEQLARTNHTMRLENQAVSTARQKQARERLIEDLVRQGDRHLWDAL